jgi:hypothetical protein
MCGLQSHGGLLRKIKSACATAESQSASASDSSTAPVAASTAGDNPRPIAKTSVSKHTRSNPCPSAVAIELDCEDTIYTTGGFTRFLVQAQKIVKDVGGTIYLTNVSETLYEGLKVLNFDKIIKITRKSTHE